MGTPREFKEGDIVGSRGHAHNDCGDVNRDDGDSGKTGQCSENQEDVENLKLMIPQKYEERKMSELSLDAEKQKRRPCQYP